MGGGKVKAHRVVLASRSLFFAALFRTGMLESRKRVISLRDKDVSSLLFQELVYSAYTDVVRVPETELVSLVALAEEYQFPAVIILASHQLHEFVTVNNAISTAQLAASMQFPQLRAFCFCILAIYLDSIRLASKPMDIKLSYRLFFPGARKRGESRRNSNSSDASLSLGVAPSGDVQNEEQKLTVLEGASDGDLEALSHMVRRIKRSDFDISSTFQLALRYFAQKGGEQVHLETSDSSGSEVYEASEEVSDTDDEILAS